jgi:hypothetical protein
MADISPKEEDIQQQQQQQQQNQIVDFSSIYKFILNPLVIVIFLLILFISIFLGNGIVSIVLTVVLILYLTFITFQIMTTYDVTSSINNDKIDVNLEYNSMELKKEPKKEVFHIPGNNLTFDNAKTVCKAFNADLATYDQVENAYNHGGEWCNYGWSEDQMALFPIQKKTHQTLQSIKGHEKDCGRPGVNGGYFDNKQFQFGANCYGIKPDMNGPSEKVMNNVTFFPQNEKDLATKKQLDALKQKINDIIISPFNLTNWRQI